MNLVFIVFIEFMTSQNDMLQGRRRFHGEAKNRFKAMETSMTSATEETSLSSEDSSEESEGTFKVDEDYEDSHDDEEFRFDEDDMNFTFDESENVGDEENDNDNLSREFSIEAFNRTLNMLSERSSGSPESSGRFSGSGSLLSGSIISEMQSRFPQDGTVIDYRKGITKKSDTGVRITSEEVQQLVQKGEKRVSYLTRCRLERSAELLSQFRKQDKHLYNKSLLLQPLKNKSTSKLDALQGKSVPRNESKDPLLECVDRRQARRRRRKGMRSSSRKPLGNTTKGKSSSQKTLSVVAPAEALSSYRLSGVASMPALAQSHLVSSVLASHAKDFNKYRRSNETLVKTIRRDIRRHKKKEEREMKASLMRNTTPDSVGLPQ